MSARAIHGGYTLIELVLVILIIGVLLAGLGIPFAAQVGNARVLETRTGLDRVKEALIGYAVADAAHRLPCPDTTGDGQQDFTNANPAPSPRCDAVEGFLPWRDLGVGASDAWGNRYRYRADDAFTHSDGVRTAAQAGTTDTAETLSGLAVQDTAGAALTSGNPNAPAAIVYSCGPNQEPDLANDADGTPNSTMVPPQLDCGNPGAADATFTQGSPIDAPAANDFDDLLVILSKYVLLNRLVQSGQWPLP